MKRILSILLLAFCTAVQADGLVDHYAWGNIAFPDETSTAGLPEAIPCVIRKTANGQPGLKCTWLETSREVLIWNPQRQQDVRYVNQVSGTCLRGKCRTSNAIVGDWNQDGYFGLSIWYRIGVSTDGKPVAYRVDTSRQVSYAEAGSLLYQFYLDIGVPDERLVGTFDGRYEGGYTAWQVQKGEVRAKTQQPTSAPGRFQWPEVKSAWCNPRMDDDCYVNDEPVAIQDLDKWLPAIHPEEVAEVEQEGGYCETILCFSSADKPLGFKPQ